MREQTCGTLTNDCAPLVFQMLYYGTLGGLAASFFWLMLLSLQGPNEPDTRWYPYPSLIWLFCLVEVWSNNGIIEIVVQNHDLNGCTRITEPRCETQWFVLVHDQPPSKESASLKGILKCNDHPLSLLHRHCLQWTLYHHLKKPMT